MFKFVLILKRFHKSYDYGVFNFRNFTVRRACTADYEGVEKLVKTIDLHENLLNDLQEFNKARRDQVRVACPCREE